MTKKRTLFALACIGILLQAAAALRADTIERIEPGNWWVGMHDPNVELLIRGDGIAALTPVVDTRDVRIVDVVRTGNANYLFVTLRIDPEADAGDIEIRFERDGKTMATYDYPLLARAPGSRERQGFGPRDVIYLITPDRFANGDPGNDNVEGYVDTLDRDSEHGRHGGDLAGIIDNLDYIDAMGYTQLWLNPVLENAQPEWSYHGYATTDYYRIDPRMGSNAQYRELSEQARQRGIGLIMDIIVNHCGSGHWWMDDLPASDWVHHAGRDDIVVTSHDREVLQDPHAVASDVAAFADGWFVPAMPDLNQDNRQLANYLIQNTIWWIEYAGLSGLRVDTWPYSDKQFLTEFSDRILAEYPALNIVGEEWSTNPSLVAYWQAETHRADGYRSSLPSVFDFPLQHALVEGLREPEAWNSGLRKIYRTIANDFVYGDPYNLVIFPDNHDMSRIHTQLGEDADLFRIANGIVLTMRGIPQLYYGSEILMSHPGTDAHGAIRSDFPGGWDGDRVNAFTGDGLDDEAASAQNWLRALLNWRQSSAAIADGRLRHFAPRDGTYVYFRIADAERVMVAVNKNAAQTALALDRFAAYLEGAETARNVIDDSVVALDDTLALPPRSITILSLAP